MGRDTNRKGLFSFSWRLPWAVGGKLKGETDAATIVSIQDSFFFFQKDEKFPFSKWHRTRERVWVRMYFIFLCSCLLNSSYILLFNICMRTEYWSNRLFFYFDTFATDEDWGKTLIVIPFSTESVETTLNRDMGKDGSGDNSLYLPTPLLLLPLLLLYYLSCIIIITILVLLLQLLKIIKTKKMMC